LVKNKSYIETMTNALRLLIVDDSKLMREAIVGMFADDENVMMEEAANGLEALALLGKFNPDVVTLDINMPGLDGIGTLKRMMIEHPVPTIMLSSLTQEGAQITFDALRYGAVDFISKPTAMIDTSMAEQMAEIRNKVEHAAQVQLSAIKYIRHEPGSAGMVSASGLGHCEHIVAIGAAEGGYGALLKIIPQLKPSDTTAYLVSLHVAAEFIDAFVGYLCTCSQVPVLRAENNAEIKPGCCYVSSGDDYMTTHRNGDQLNLHVSEAPFASRRGAIDMMMFSVVEVMDDECTGVLLSGIGEDGAEGIEHILHQKGRVIVQNPKTCLYKALVQNAIDKAQVDNVVSDTMIAEEINKIG